MKKAKSYIGIPGIKYRCRVRRVSSGGIDAFSQFILDYVLDKEDRISVLLQSFGLPKGVIEDALTELLEANRVSLDVLTGRLMKSAASLDRREYRLDDPQEVWQDEFTGAILPFSMVRQFGKPEPSPAEGLVLWLRETKARDLMDLPAARALGSLLSADRTLVRDRGGWVADGLVYPERVGAFDLYLPIDQVEVDGKAFDFVTARELPTWLTRSWSFELATSELSSVSPEARVSQQDRIRTIVEEARAGDGLEETSGAFFRKAMLRDTLDGWQENFAKSLNQLVGLARQRNAFALEHLKDKIKGDIEEFTGRILSSGRIRFARSESTHLEELWREAKSYLLVAHNGFTIEDLNEIWARTEGSNAKPIHLLMLDCSGREASAEIESWMDARAEREFGGEVVLVRTEVNVESEVSVADGREARVGSLRALLSGRPVLIAEGKTVMQHLAASLSKDVNPQEAGGWWVLRQLSPTLSQSLEAPEVLENLLQDFAGLKSEMDAMIDYLAGKVSDGMDVDLSELEGTNPNDSVRDKEEEEEQQQVEHKARSWREHVELRNEEVCEHLLDEFPKQRMLVAPFADGDWVTVRQQALEVAGSQKGHEIEIILSHLPRRFAEGVFIEELRKVSSIGSAIRFTVCPSIFGEEPSTEVMKALETFKQKLGAENITIQVSNTELPCGLILDRKMIAMGWGNWLDTMAQDVGLFGFIVESEELASQIRSFTSL